VTLKLMRSYGETGHVSGIVSQLNCL
jgi:hypothetical protein